MQRVFLDRSRRLSTAAQTLLCVAAADDSTRVSVVRQAAEVLGVGPAALTEAEESGLLTIAGTDIEFRHPLVRSAVYQGAATHIRQQAHRALAQVMTGGQDADRRAWHLAAAVDEPDDEVVAALDDAARRAAARGGFEAASAAFERAAELTGDEQARSTRLLAAATNSYLAAQLPRAMRLATTARAGVTDPVVRADLDRLRGRIEFVAGSVPVGVGIWNQAARDVVATDPQRAREIGMIAAAGSTFLPEQDRTDLNPAELLASTDQDTSTRAQCFTQLLTGFHQLNHDGLAAAAVSLRQAVTLGQNLSETDLLTNLGIATFHLGDDDGFRRLFSRMLTQARNDGAIGLVLFALPRLALADLSGGNWTGAVAHATEAAELARNTGQPGLAAMPLAQLALVAALRGDQRYDGFLAELDRITAGQPAGILGVLMQDTRRWAQGCHAALTGEPAAALHHFQQMTQPTLLRLAAYDRLDIATRTGHLDAAAASNELELFAEIADTPHARRVVAYGRALLAARGIHRRRPRRNSSPCRWGLNPAQDLPCDGPAPTSLTGSSSPVPPPGRCPERCGPPANLSRPGRRRWLAAGRVGTPTSGEPPGDPGSAATMALAAQETDRWSSAQGLPEPQHDVAARSSSAPSHPTSTSGTSSPKRVSPRAANWRGLTLV